MSGTRARKIAAITRALALVTEALDVIDANGVGETAAPYIDLAQHRLRDELETAR